MPDRTKFQIKLGAYEEAFRLFLVDRMDFPTAAVVIVKVASSQAPIMQAIWFPHGEKVDSVHHWEFMVPGIMFELWAGGGISNWHREGCIVSNARHPLLLLSNDSIFGPSMGSRRREPTLQEIGARGL